MKTLSEPHLAAWRAFITAHALVIDQIDHELAAADQISLAWYDVLIELVEAPERRMRLSDLAKKTVLTRSGVTRAVTKLEEAGLLTREPDPQDRRGAYAVLTDQGRAKLSSAWAIYAQGIIQHFAQHLSEEEAGLLRRIFERITHALRDEPTA